MSGIGFIGGGLIFVRRDAVRGLTTAATIWLTCAVGMACGGGLPILALAATALHFLVVRGYPLLSARLIPDTAASAVEARLTYRTGTALLPRLMQTCTRRGYRIVAVKVERFPGRTDNAARVVLGLEGTDDPARLASELFQDDGVIDVEMPRQPRTTSERAWPSGNLTHLLPKMPPQPGPWTAGRNVLCDGESPIDTSFKAVLLDSEMRVLLGTNPRGEWELLGGRAEAQDATPQDTVRREVREEAGIDITVGAIIDTWFYDIPDTGRVAVTSYLARPVDDVSPVLGTEHADLAFFHARELDDINLPEGYRHSIRLGIDQLQATWGK